MANCFKAGGESVKAGCGFGQQASLYKGEASKDERHLEVGEAFMCRIHGDEEKERKPGFMRNLR